MRDDLPEIVAMGRNAGFGFIQVNTNGIRLAKDETFLKRLSGAGLDSIFLQVPGSTRPLGPPAAASLAGMLWRNGDGWRGSPAEHIPNCPAMVRRSPRHLRATSESDPTPPANMPLGKNKVMDLDQFLRQVRARTLAVSAMAFQDAWTLDLDRIKDCCIHVADARGRLIPFCLYNLTTVSGKGLYRT